MQTEKPKAIHFLEGRLGEEIFVSKWYVISQQETDTFAKLTDDEDPMHNDPEWAAKTDWGGTIVQAAHVLSLGAGATAHAHAHAHADTKLDTESDGNNYMLNYGYDRVQVISPLRVGHCNGCST
jgi:acyl dehydratase